MLIGLAHYLTVGAILFTLGIFGVFLNRKNVIIMLMSIELMLLAVSINFVAFSVFLGDLVGQQPLNLVLGEKRRVNSGDPVAEGGWIFDRQDVSGCKHAVFQRVQPRVGKVFGAFAAAAITTVGIDLFLRCRHWVFPLGVGSVVKRDLDLGVTHSRIEWGELVMGSPVKS